MSETTRTKTGKKPFDGKDSQGWVIKDSNGKRIGEGSFDGYKSAAAAADSYTNETGLFAGAVRV